MAEKMTKVEKFEKVLSYLTEDAELTAFIQHEIEQVKKKNASRSDKPTKNQIANAGLMDAIYARMEDGVKYTVTQINKDFDEVKELSGNKVSALIRMLKLDGRVIRVEEKGKAYFVKA